MFNEKYKLWWNRDFTGCFWQRKTTQPICIAVCCCRLESNLVVIHSQCQGPSLHFRRSLRRYRFVLSKEGEQWLVVSLGALSMARTFSGSGWSPSASIIYPKYSTEGAMNKHLPLLKRRPACSILLSTSSSAAMWPLSSGPVMSTSSIYTTTPGMSCSKFSITRWNIPGADETPNGRRE